MFILVILCGFAVLSFIAIGVFHAYPFSMDEYNYFYQAQIFASGHLYLHVDPRIHDLFEMYMVSWKGKLFSKYPPGCSLFFLPGVKLGIPFLINPLFSVGTMLIVYLMATELTGSLYALLALLMMAGSAYFLGYGASYCSQSASLFLASLALFFYRHYTFSKQTVFLCGAALVLSAATLVRPLDALCLWIVFCWDMITNPTANKKRSWLLFIGLSAIGTLLLMGYNKILIDQWTIAPYPVFQTDFRLFYGDKSSSWWVRIIAFAHAYFVNLKKNGLVFTRHFFPYLGLWIPFIMLSFARARQENSPFKAFRPILIGYILVTVGIYIVHPMRTLGWPEYGARYWYPLLLPLALLLAQGFKVLDLRCPRTVFMVILGVCLIAEIGQDIYYFQGYAKRFQFVRQLQADIQDRCPEKSIVILNESKNWTAPPFVQCKDLKRNPFLRGPRLYTWSKKNISQLQSVFSDYSICEYPCGQGN